MTSRCEAESVGEPLAIGGCDPPAASSSTVSITSTGAFPFTSAATITRAITATSTITITSTSAAVAGHQVLGAGTAADGSTLARLEDNLL
jgi:spore coat protein U-like protein